MIARYRIRQWVVVQTEANREKWAAENVARQGREVYLPKIEIMKGATRLAQSLHQQAIE
jgi:hypothetical protein